MDLMRSIPELEADYLEIVRNLDSDVIATIEASPELPEAMRNSPKLVCAHEAYWQIQAFSGDPRATMWHPV
ncbi:MAG: hypothetical protein UY04_C0020G0008 [Parcubacteria group bacterium GW2011_GWA2_47_7]|nr:MAG: hypothetical protein UY04_C0020G0008 [Parcubacteria group bacterium GW2011_GWA2_47_7]